MPSRRGSLRHPYENGSILRIETAHARRKWDMAEKRCHGDIWIGKQGIASDILAHAEPQSVGEKNGIGRQPDDRHVAGQGRKRPRDGSSRFAIEIQPRCTAHDLPPRCVQSGGTCEEWRLQLTVASRLDGKQAKLVAEEAHERLIAKMARIVQRGKVVKDALHECVAIGTRQCCPRGSGVGRGGFVGGGARRARQ